VTNRVSRGVLLSGWLFLAASPVFGQATGTPESAAVKICSSCHGMQMVTDTPRDYDAWHDTVQKMIDRGARWIATVEGRDEFVALQQSTGYTYE